MKVQKIIPGLTLVVMLLMNFTLEKTPKMSFKKDGFFIGGQQVATIEKYDRPDNELYSGNIVGYKIKDINGNIILELMPMVPNDPLGIVGDVYCKLISKDKTYLINKIVGNPFQKNITAVGNLIEKFQLINSEGINEDSLESFAKKNGNPEIANYAKIIEWLGSTTQENLYKMPVIERISKLPMRLAMGYKIGKGNVVFATYLKLTPEINEFWKIILNKKRQPIAAVQLDFAGNFKKINLVNKTVMEKGSLGVINESERASKLENLILATAEFLFKEKLL